MTVRETHCGMHWMQLIYPVNIIHHKNNCGLDLSLAIAFFDPKTKICSTLSFFTHTYKSGFLWLAYMFCLTARINHVMDCHPIQ